MTQSEDADKALDIDAFNTSSPDGVGGSSLLLQAVVGVLKARSASVDDTAGTRDFNAGQQLEGVTRSDADLGGVPAITLEPQFNHPDLHPTGTFRWPPRSLWPRTPECMPWTTDSPRKRPSLGRSTTVWRPIVG